MIVIDTNVLSEMMRPAINPRVWQWVTTSGRIYITAITVAKISYGVARLPTGRRRQNLEDMANELFAQFEHLTLPFDSHAAFNYGTIVAAREAAGRPISMADAQIAAICRTHGATCATRNIDDFFDTGIDLVNPWSAQS